MSTKVCVTAVRPEWSDAVTIDQLGKMLDALRDLGYGDDTPITYLNDCEHVWLETVHDDDVVIVIDPEPRVVDKLDIAQRGAEWIDRDGDLWRWDSNLGWASSDDGFVEHCPYGISEFYGPFTEVL